MSQRRSIQAVCFDAGGTLIEPWPSAGEIYAQVAAERGCGRVDAAQLNRQFAAAWKAKAHFNYTRRDWRWVVRESFQGLLPGQAVDGFFDTLYERFAQPEVWRIYGDVVPALERLAADEFQLGVVSNWDERLRPLLGKLNLARYFGSMTVSCEAGFQKPSPVIFEVMARKLGLPPDQILHVGDSLVEDVEGARNAGWQSVLVDREKGTEWPHRIRSLAELATGLG